VSVTGPLAELPADPDELDEPDDEQAAAVPTTSRETLAAATTRQLNLRIAGMIILLRNGLFTL
jgi:hypothetical protein